VIFQVALVDDLKTMMANLLVADGAGYATTTRAFSYC